MDVAEPGTVALAPTASKILRVLAGADTAFTVRELARLAGVSHTQAGRVVEHLSRHGLVLSEPAGPAIRCRLNRDHLAVPFVTGLANLRAALFDELTKEVKGWPVQPAHCSLFGSAARGDGTTASDLDILVVRPGGVPADDEAWQAQLSEAAERIFGRTGNHVSWFVLNPAELAGAVTSGEAAAEAWVDEGILIAGKPLSALVTRAGR